MNEIKRSIAKITIITMVLSFSLFGAMPVANAANLTSVSDTMSTLAASTSANHTIQFTTPTGVAAGETITVTFPSGFDLASIAFGDVDVTDNGADLTLAATASTTTWGVSVSGQVLTITSDTGTIAAGDTVAIEIGTNATYGVAGSNQILNSTAGTDKVISIGGTFSDSGQLAVTILSDDSVSVTATVDPTFEFAISETAIGFGDLTTANARYATNDAAGSDTDVVAHSITVATNATSGYAITYNGATLTDGSNTIDAISAGITADADGTPGSEQFGFCAASATGTIATGYNCSGPDWKFVPGATTQFASGTGATDTVTYNMHYLANISSTTEAGSYSTSITYIGTGTF